MIVPPWCRLLLLILAGIVPRWQSFLATSSDYSVRGLLMPMVDSIGIACVIIIARTRNPLVDGEPTQQINAKIVNPESDPVNVQEAPSNQPPPQPDPVKRRE